MIFLSHCANANEFKLVIYTDHFSPYNFKNDNDQLVGINLDIVKDICTIIAIICEFKLLPWKRAYSLVQKDPHSGIVSIAKNTEREPLFNWIGPLASSQTFFYKLKANKQLRINNLKDAVIPPFLMEASCRISVV